jgi:putative ABC transport system substrate-binding protein
MWKEIQDASRALAVTPLAWEVRRPDDIGRAFSEIRAEKVGAVIVLPHPAAGTNLRQIAGLAAAHRLPAVYLSREFALAGGLMSYGPSVAGMWRRSAEYVDKILKGAKPGELPVDQPTSFELVINRKTAAAFGLALPLSLLVRADEILQ